MTVPNKIYNLTRTTGRRMGQKYTDIDGFRTNYKPQFAVTNLSLEAGLNQMVRGEITYIASYTGRNIDPDLDHMHLNWWILPSYPHSWQLKEVAAGADSQGIMYLRSWIAGTSPYLNKYQSYLVANGLQMEMTNYDPHYCDVDDEYVYYSANMFSLKIFFLNPIVNSLSRLWAPTVGRVEVVLTGLGFDNAESELDEGGPDRGGWDDKVDAIEFIGLQGQGTTTLTASGGDFTVDNNTQITIPANKFPALSAGTYNINLKKLNVALEAAATITGYAGDWICDSDGRVRSSDRMCFYISDVFTDSYGAEGGGFRKRKKGPLILTDWHLKDRSDGTEVMKYYSMATVRCPDRVYKGSLSAISSIPRGFDDKTGLFKVTDITLDLANNDLEFSKLLAGTTILKNQIVKVYQIYPPGPFAWRSLICSTIVDDYSFEGDIFKVKLKDITQKYFRRSVPLDVCTADYEGFDYSNIHPDSIGAPVPEVLGLCSLTTGEFRGQIEALCIDTVNFIYVAANRALKSIDQIYSDNPIAVDPSDYVVSVEADGRTYITFTGDQEDKKVTFNCKGYMFSGLNSANGYVQNPAYIILYLFLIILEIPPDFIDFNSFDEVADVFTNMDEAEAGKLILQFQHDPMDVLQDLLAGSKCYPAKDGRLALGKKDESNYETNNSDPAPVLFRQIDAVGKSIRKYNLRDAINLINAAYDFIPTWDAFKANLSQEADVSIDPWNPRPVEDNRTSRTTRIRRGRRRVRPWVR